MRGPRPRRKYREFEPEPANPPGLPLGYPLKEHYLRVLAETAEAMRLYNLTHGSGCRTRLNAQERKEAPRD
jgi:hypothetical protein